jgi:NitT/TauT family transport system ATP-binding protein
VSAERLTDPTSAAAPVGDGNGMDDRLVLTAHGISKVFPTPTGTLTALRDINMDVADGEFVTLVGPSGCGKSTLLNIFAGLMSPTSGRLLFRGERHEQPRQEIGMMFQSPVLLPWRTILANMMLPAEVLGLDRDAHRARCREMVELVGLEGFEDSYPRQLSGGMQQRVALARVLAYEPRVLQLDEPFGALDEFTRETMNLELQRIWQAAQRTILFVTHNITEAVFLADRVVAMTPRPGCIAGIVPVELERPRTRETMRKPEFNEKVFEVRELLGVAR